VASKIAALVVIKMSTEVVCAGIVVVALSLRQELQKRKSRKIWVKNWVARREKYGASNNGDH
jgi:hypothetical protein